MRMLVSVIQCIRCHFGNNKLHYTYMIGKSAVPGVKSYLDLGVIRSSLNDSLEHISHAIKRARRLSGFWFYVRLLLGIPHSHAELSIYVKPILMYTSPSWLPWQRYLHADIESAQR